MTNLIVNLAYKIESSKSYHRFRTFLVNILLNTTTQHKKIFDLFIIFLVISTVGILIYEVNNTLPPYVIYYEIFAIIIFICEWLGRVMVSFESHKQIIKDYEESQLLNLEYKLSSSIRIITKKKFEYIFSLPSIIDLLAILPSYRPLRILRIFLIFRLFKVLKYTNSLNQFIHVFVEKKHELSLLLFLYLLVIFFSGTILYVYEGNGLNPKISNFFDAIYWSFITVSTIGYGDITPVSEAGKSVTLILILTGYTVLAFFTSIVTSSISEKLDIIKEQNALSQTAKLKDFILVCGYGSVGQNLVDNLKRHHYQTLVIDKDPTMVQMAERQNINVIKDDATNIDLLKKISINQNVKYVIALSDDDSVNLSIILAVRSISKNIPIISRANNDNVKKKLLLAGANEVISVNEATSLVALGHINSPVAYEAIDDILIDYHGAMMSEIEIFETSPFIGKTLSSIDFEKYNISFVGIVKNGNKENFIFNPNQDDFVIGKKDTLIIIGFERTINEFKNYLQITDSIKGFL
jgi:voltage-gated potassium channel